MSRKRNPRNHVKRIAAQEYGGKRKRYIDDVERDLDHIEYLGYDIERMDSHQYRVSSRDAKNALELYNIRSVRDTRDIVQGLEMVDDAVNNSRTPQKNYRRLGKYYRKR